MTPFAEIYRAAINLAHLNKQTVGDKNDYYITLQQLERILTKYQKLEMPA